MMIFFNNKGKIYQHAVPPKTTVNIECYISVFKFFCNTYRESIVNWKRIRYYIVMMLTRMSLFLFNNIFVNAVLKSFHMFFTVQILHHAISVYFLYWSRRFSGRNFNTDSNVLQVGLNYGTVPYYLRKGTLKGND